MGDYMQVQRRVVKEVEQAVENQIIKIIVGQQGPMEVSEAVPFNSPFQAVMFSRSGFLSLLGWPISGYICDQGEAAIVGTRDNTDLFRKLFRDGALDKRKIQLDLPDERTQLPVDIVGGGGFAVNEIINRVPDILFWMAFVHIIVCGALKQHAKIYLCFWENVFWWSLFNWQGSCACHLSLT